METDILFLSTFSSLYIAAHILNLLHGKLPHDFDEKFGLSWNLIKAAIGVKQGKM